MKRLLFILTLFVFFIFGLNSQTNIPSVTYPLTSDLNGIGEPGITVYPVVFGNGYHATNPTTGSLSYDFTTHCGCTGLRVWNWRVTGSPAPSLNYNTANAQNRYVEFSFTNNKGSDIVINSFDFTGSAGFTSGCTGVATYSYLRWSLDAGAFQWIRNASTSCNSEQTLNIGNSCNSYSRPNSAACGTSGWTLSNPITVANGQRIRFRVYIATSNDQSSWRVGFSNVVINRTSPLAVTLNSFNANCDNNGTDINWSTASEQNASHFDLERSSDGETWNNVTTVPANGNSNSLKTYSVKDNVRLADDYYYRLRQVDFDGAEEVFGPITVNCGSAPNNSLLVFPNPSSGEFGVEVSSNEVLENAAVVVYDISGKNLLKKDVNSKLKGTNLVYFTDNNLAPGTYLVVVESQTKNNFTPVKLVIH